jgi:hypothetical protein
MTTPHAIRYREKVRELYEAAASAPNDQLRREFTSLAQQYEYLAAALERLSDSSRPAPAWSLNP